MKSNRQSMILELIAQQDIETQNQMMEALRQRGIKSTQATLSRDIKELRLVKELSPSGAYRYVAAARDELSDYDVRLRKIFRECVISYGIAQNLVVLRTLPGLANAAASALDNMSVPDLVGSIAGDDTVFLAMKDNASAELFCHAIEAMF
ncbi:MAG: arginine repressor [Oscillospiraceae bacterium]|nr:arginine repressor [Oscillospiraceae bacterium]